MCKFAVCLFLTAMDKPVSNWSEAQIAIREN